MLTSNRLSTTDAAGPLANQTNLALKGIIGLGAMSVIADITNHSADAIYYKVFKKLITNYGLTHLLRESPSLMSRYGFRFP